ncbi:MAG: hypothetical protein U1E12_06570, partial [Hydrogenophaga sp.]|uniref:hypothetical protein n=1 Tax=Hydrogenophaga sp. TaxID=1904254 RepID=UPI002AB9AA9F
MPKGLCSNPIDIPLLYGGRAGIRVKMILKRKSSKSSSCYVPDEFGRAFPVTAKVAISAQPLEK